MGTLNDLLEASAYIQNRKFSPLLKNQLPSDTGL